MVAGSGPPGSSQEYEHFIEVRRHVKRMQAGTPLLLRTGAAAGAGAGGGQEDLRICTFWVTQDLQSLRWREQEGDSPGTEAACEVPLSAIAEVVEDTSRKDDEDHHALTLVLRPGASKQVSGSMGLICASPEDLATWRQGLKFLVGSLPPPQPPRGGAAAGAAAALTGEQAPEPESEENLRETLREQLEINEKLRKEGELLREMVKRKDATIAMLHRDLQRGAIIGESSGKTESTSRESDEHLSYREAAILRRKNRRLQKAVRAKQQTVSDLLSIIGRVSSQQGAESSAVEEDDEDEEASDGTQNTAVLIPGGSGRRAAGRRSGSLADLGGGAASGDSAAGGACLRAAAGRSGSLVDVSGDSAGGGACLLAAAGRSGSLVDVSGDSAGGGGRGQSAGRATTGSSETDDVREELAALAGKRDRLTVGGGPRFAPSPREGAAAAAAAAAAIAEAPAPRSPAARLQGGGGASMACLDAPLETCHGRCYGFEAERDSWPKPRLVASSKVEARPGYESMGASEYEDAPESLRGKVSALARLVRAAECRVLYSGAGLSTAAGIDDYATRAEASVSGGPFGGGGLGGTGNSFRSPFCAQPTLAHRVLVAMYGAGLLQHWVNQNHDGLPQKAGLPQEAMNEIHGAWHAPDNPVVVMSGELREDLLLDLRTVQRRADLVLAVGTSLCGMNADSLVQEPALRAARGEAGQLGAVIVGLQQTVYDADATLRIYGRCDEVFALLAEELGLVTPPALPEGEFFVPPALAGRGDDDCLFEGLRYDATGGRDKGQATTLDLREDAELVITGGVHAGAVGEVDSRDREGNFRCRFRLKPKSGKLRAPVAMLLGRWWVQAAVDATVPRLPVVNKPSEDAAGPDVDKLRMMMQTYAQ